MHTTRRHFQWVIDCEGRHLYREPRVVVPPPKTRSQRFADRVEQCSKTFMKWAAGSSALLVMCHAVVAAHAAGMI